MPLSDTDRRLLDAFVENKVLNQVDSGRLSDPTGTITVMCADGDQLLDFIGRHTGSFAATGPRRHHLFTLNGGALLIPDHSPLVQPHLGENRVLQQHILDAIALKGIHTIVLYTHFPCGAAYRLGLGAAQVLHLLFEAKRIVRALTAPHGVGADNVVGFCHVDFGGQYRTLYHPCRDTFYRWCEDHGIALP